MFENFIPHRSPELDFAREQLQVQREQGSLNVAADDSIHLSEKEGRADLARWQQDLSDELELLKYDLERKYKNNKGEWVEEPNTKPLLNKAGLYNIISMVKIYFSRNLMMSNLSEEIINRIMRNLACKLVLNLGANFDIYEIEFHNLSLVTEIILGRVEPTLYRSLNNGERDYLTTINKRIESFGSFPSQGKPGLLKGLLGGGG